MRGISASWFPQSPFSPSYGLGFPHPPGSPRSSRSLFVSKALAASFRVAIIKVIVLFTYVGDYVSAHQRANPQVRPYNRFPYFYERNLVSRVPLPG